ncbi:radical SAM protein [bacterium]|nr:radical SAM protein [bacterium]MBU1065228.1 radical SAM protein [bacterium]MBU1634715.1 radical SAM protein [bacterium]MBU1873830.1 radical SAM protein [bacterium]
MLLRLQNSIIYGPIASRRLGRSLGVNLLPFYQKTCTLDCLYCQYGWSRFSNLETAKYPSVTEILSALEQALKNLPVPPDYITFSGNGEPTLHPEFGSIVEEVKQLRDSLAPIARVAVLSNSTTVTRDSIRAALEKLDDRIMKLDAGNAASFEIYNRPYPSFEFNRIVKGLASLSDVTIQALFTGGKDGNYSPGSILDWVDKIVEIKPRKVQIYTLARGYPAPTIENLSRTELNHIRQRLSAEHIAATVY